AASFIGRDRLARNGRPFVSRRHPTAGVDRPLVRFLTERRCLLLVFLVVASCALLTAVLALALLREIRLRKALEALLQRILNTWRRFHATKDRGEKRRPADDPDANSDPRL